MSLKGVSSIWIELCFPLHGVNKAEWIDLKEFELENDDHKSKMDLMFEDYKFAGATLMGRL